jgi:hypothetical protein
MEGLIDMPLIERDLSMNVSQVSFPLFLQTKLAASNKQFGVSAPQPIWITWIGCLL